MKWFLLQDSQKISKHRHIRRIPYQQANCPKQHCQNENEETTNKHYKRTSKNKKKTRANTKNKTETITKNQNKKNVN